MPTPAYSSAVLFTGELESVSVKGSVFRSKFLPGGLVFSRRIPSFLVQPGCNYPLFSVGCRLSQAAWEIHRQLQNPETRLPVHVHAETLTRTLGGLRRMSIGSRAGYQGSFGLACRLPILQSALSLAQLCASRSRDRSRSQP